MRDLLNIKLLLPKKKKKYTFGPYILGVFSIWFQCFNFIQLGPCVFKPFSILSLESTPLVLILRDRWKIELANSIWPTQLPSNCVPPFIRMSLTWVCKSTKHQTHM